MLSLRDSTYSTKIFVGALVPFVVIVIFERALSSTSQNSTTPLIPLKDIYLFLYLAAIEMPLLSFISTGCIFRVTEHENRIVHFLFVSQGSKWAHRLANFTYDFLELTFLSFFTLISTKLVLFGKPTLTFLECALALLVVFHNMGKILMIGYPVSYLFTSKKSLLSYYSLFNMGAVICLTALAAFSFMNYDFRNYQDKKLLLNLLNYLNVTKIAANIGLHLAPHRIRMLAHVRDEVDRQFGGLETNLCLLAAHLLVYLGILVVIDQLKYSPTIKPKPRHERIAGIPQGLLAPQELAEENEFARSGNSQVSVVDVEQTFGDFTAVDKVSFGVGKGKLFTLLGPNGAGKTSLLDILCGITNRTGGQIQFEGGELERYKMKNLCFCLQKNYLWEYLTFQEHIEIVGSWRGLDKATIAELVSDVDKGLDIGKNLRIKAVHLSGGNQRKLNTVLALLSAPKIYILDEPTAGMDPKARRYFWNVLKTYKEKSSCTLILTTHTANEAEELSDKVGIMINGKLVRANELHHITDKGFVVKLYAEKKLHDDWPSIMQEFEHDLKEVIEGDHHHSEIQLLQSNTYNRASFRVPLCTEFPDLNSIMKHCVDFCSRVRQQRNKKVAYFAGKLDLEQAFFAYASYQQDNDTINN